MEEFKDENIKIKFLGDISKFSEDIKDMINTVESETKNRTGLNLNIAMNYGGRAEIVRAVKNISKDVQDGKEIDRKVGYNTKQILVDWINRA